MELKNNKINNRKKKDTGKKKLYRILAGSMIIVGSSVLGIMASTFSNVIDSFNLNSDKKISFGSIQGIKDAVGSLKEMSKPIDQEMNVLLLGSDVSYSRGRAINEGPTRSDTMMFAHVDPIHENVNVISIPRDTRVLIPEHRYYDKINSAFAYGGERLARRTVANLIGVPVHHYVVLKVHGLMNIVDILGGIEVDVEKEMHYLDRTAKLDINLHKGRQLLNGSQAHGYVRFRHDEIGDIGRVQRQQKFINAVIDKLLNPATIVKIPELVNEVMKNIETDMSTTDLIRLGNYLKSLRKEQIKMVMLPGRFGNIGGASYWLIDELLTKSVITEMFPSSIYADKTEQTTPNPAQSGQPEQAQLIDKRKYRITVLNGTEEPRLAAKAARILRENGWSVWSVSESKNHLTKTQVILQTGKTRPLDALKEALGIDVDIVNASVGDIYTDYTIIIGTDFSSYLKQKQDSLEIGAKKFD